MGSIWEENERKGSLQNENTDSWPTRCLLPRFEAYLCQPYGLLRDAKPKVISEALGYSSVTFTMDTHSHIIEGMQSDAMALLNEVLPPGENGIFGKITPI